MERTAQVITLDVWGNVEDGWEVNQSFRTSLTVQFEDTAAGFASTWKDQEVTDANILKALIGAGILNGSEADFSVEWQTETDISISEAETSRPVIDLLVQ